MHEFVIFYPKLIVTEPILCETALEQYNLVFTIGAASMVNYYYYYSYLS